MIEPLVIVIGYDPKEDDAYQVCRASLLAHSSRPLHIVKLDQAALRRAGWYRRQWHQDGSNRVDAHDLKPFSTDFSFTRFLVPALNLYQGWALYCDGDFLFTRDIAELFALAEPKYSVMCVQHEHDPVEKTKMGGLVQSRYRRKNWSSLVLYNCGHEANELLTGYVVNEYPGSFLHAFSWLKDEEIGAIPHRWNWLSGVDEATKKIPAGIHFTLGTPSVVGCQNMPYAAQWRAVRNSLEPVESAA